MATGQSTGRISDGSVGGGGPKLYEVPHYMRAREFTGPLTFRSNIQN